MSKKAKTYPVAVRREKAPETVKLYESAGRRVSPKPTGTITLGDRRYHSKARRREWRVADGKEARKYM